MADEGADDFDLVGSLAWLANWGEEPDEGKSDIPQSIRQLGDITKKKDLQYGCDRITQALDDMGEEWARIYNYLKQQYGLE